MSEQLTFLARHLPDLLFGFPGQRPGGLLMSLLLAAGAITLGLLLALGIGAGYAARTPWVRWPCRLYVQLFRGLPLILLLLLVHQLLGVVRRQGMDLTVTFSALVALTLYGSAYLAGVVRAGLQAVPDHLVESARLMGSTPAQTFYRVRLAYAARVMLPAFTGEAISLFKDTSVVVILGVADLMTVARVVLGSDVGHASHWVGLYLVAGGLYFAVAFSLSRLARRWETRRQMRNLVHSLANYG